MKPPDATQDEQQTDKHQPGEEPAEALAGRSFGVLGEESAALEGLALLASEAQAGVDGPAVALQQAGEVLSAQFDDGQQGDGEEQDQEHRQN